VAAQAAARWDLYRLLGDRTRVRLLALCATEELAVSELAELLREGQPKVSRHAATLRDAGLLLGRKQGTWMLLRAAPEAGTDAVIADALEAGAASCTSDGTLERVSDVLAARDAATREFFARGGKPLSVGAPTELAAYLKAIAPLVDAREIAVDAGCGDGALLEVLAPVFNHVIALDRSEAQLDLARERTARRGYRNVSFVSGEIDGPEIRAAIAKRTRTKNGRPKRTGADAVFAARVLHHDAVPAKAMRALVELTRKPSRHQPGGHVLVLDYDHHRDEKLREQQADLWLGFSRNELEVMAQDSGLIDSVVSQVPGRWCGEGPDRHLTWLLMSGRRGSRQATNRGTPK